MIKLYDDIKITKGVLCSTLIDLTRKCFFRLSNDNLEVIQQGTIISEDVLFFLKENELINQFESNINSFMPINESYDNFNYPIVDTIFIEFELNHFSWFKNSFFSSLIDNCHISLTITSKLQMNEYKKLLSLCSSMLNESPIDTIQINGFYLSNIVINDPRIILIEDKSYPLLKSELNFYREALVRHTYFNKNVFINNKGEIKNAPECEEEFGNINDLGSVEDLKQIVATPEFQKYWYVHKDLCDVCKDCEFRHMCIDNRLPYQRKDGSWYHKTECNYNPYICKWKDEEGYKTLEECGVVSKENGFSINHEKVAAINKTLWEEETENA